MRRLVGSLHDRPLIRIEVGGEGRVDAHGDVWLMTAAWEGMGSPGIQAVDRWLRGIRPQGGARSAQTQRARAQYTKLGLATRGLAEEGVIWATPWMEYAGAIAFRSLHEDGSEFTVGETNRSVMTTPDIEDLIGQAIFEMRKESADTRKEPERLISPSGTLPKIVVHESPVDGSWRRADREHLSTHIVKHEDRAAFPGEAAAEVTCQRALRKLGIRAARTRAKVAGGYQLVVSERADREVGTKTGKVTAIHQEEWGNACGEDPDNILQQPGRGGGWSDLQRLLDRRNGDDPDERRHLWRAVAAVVLLGHRDMHRRNVGIQYPGRTWAGEARLAPLYDVSSGYGLKEQWCAMGMLVGGSDDVMEIGEAQWDAQAQEWGIGRGKLRDVVKETAARLPRAVESAIEETLEEDAYLRREQAQWRLEVMLRGVKDRCRTTEVMGRAGGCESKRREEDDGVSQSGHGR